MKLRDSIGVSLVFGQFQEELVSTRKLVLNERKQGAARKCPHSENLDWNFQSNLNAVIERRAVENVYIALCLNLFLRLHFYGVCWNNIYC